MMKPTSIYDRYEIVKVPFPFSDIKKVKLRPALILSLSESFNSKTGLSIMVMITSMKLRHDLWPSDVIIKDFQASGLPVPSIVRFKLFTLDNRLIVGRLGLLSELDKQAVENKMRGILFL